MSIRTADRCAPAKRADGSVRQCAHLGPVQRPRSARPVPLPRTADSASGSGAARRAAADHRPAAPASGTDAELRRRHVAPAAGPDDGANAHRAGHTTHDAADDRCSRRRRRPPPRRARDRSAPDRARRRRLLDRVPDVCDGQHRAHRARRRAGGLDEWALAEIERLEQCWSRFRPDSELATLHARAGEWIDVSASMLLALTCAADLHRAHGGPLRSDDSRCARARGLRPHVRARRAGRDAGATDDCAVAAPVSHRVEIDVDAVARAAPPRVRIDLGGVGKGLAADLVSRGLVDRGARSVLVSLGGDMRARGERRPTAPGAFPVEHPFDDERDRVRASRSPTGRWCRARAASARGRAAVAEYHHIIDPRTGDSTRPRVVAVVADGARRVVGRGRREGDR